MNTKEQIDQFLNKSEPIAISGVSRNKKKFGTLLFTQLKETGFNVVPVNPHLHEVDASICYNSIKELPENINRLIICNNKDLTTSILAQSIEKGIENVWIQNHSETKSSLNMAKQHNINLISKQCVFMFAKPEGMHAFHRKIKKFFGTLPQ